MSNFKFKKIEALPGQKHKKPECSQKENKVVRICSERDCKNKKDNQLMCSNQKCQCNMTAHKNCFHFINFQVLTKTMQQFNNVAMNDIFKNVLTCLSNFAQTTIKKYNEILQIYQNFLMPSPLDQIKKSLNSNGSINKRQSVELQKFYDKFNQFQVPQLRNIESYKIEQTKIAQDCTKFQQSAKQFYQKLFKNIVSIQKLGKQIIQQKNIQKINETIKAQKKARSQDQQGKQINSSDKNDGKKQ